jgi:hypothetical protein
MLVKLVTMYDTNTLRVNPGSWSILGILLCLSSVTMKFVGNEVEDASMVHSQAARWSPDLLRALGSLVHRDKKFTMDHDVAVLSDSIRRCDTGQQAQDTVVGCK